MVKVALLRFKTEPHGLFTDQLHVKCSGAIPRLISHSLICIVGVRSVMANFRRRVWNVMKDVVSSEKYWHAKIKTI